MVLPSLSKRYQSYSQALPEVLTRRSLPTGTIDTGVALGYKKYFHMAIATALNNGRLGSFYTFIKKTKKKIPLKVLN